MQIGQHCYRLNSTAYLHNSVY